MFATVSNTFGSSYVSCITSDPASAGLYDASRTTNGSLRPKLLTRKHSSLIIARKIRETLVKDTAPEPENAKCGVNCTDSAATSSIDMSRDPSLDEAPQVGEPGRSPPVSPRAVVNESRVAKPKRRNALGFDSLVAYVVMVNKFKPDRGTEQNASLGTYWGDKHWDKRITLSSPERPVRKGNRQGKLECISECTSVDEVTDF